MEELISDVENFEDVRQGTNSNLIAPLEQARSPLTHDNPRNDPRACSRLDCFQDRVDNNERRITLTADQAADLRTQAEDIRDMLGC